MHALSRPQPRKPRTKRAVTYDEHKSNPRFPRGPLALRFAFLAVLSVVLMSADARFHHLDQIRRVLSAVVYPVQLVVDAPTTVASWLSDNFQARRTLSRENEALRRRQRELHVSLQRLAALEAENARLRALMDSSARLGERVLHGEIMAVDIDDRFRHRVVIDRGRHAGAFAGQALVSDQGVVGQVLRADDLTSEAILISDPSHAIPVEVNRTGLLTIAYGTGDPERLDLPYVPKSADLQEGDLLVTSGLGGSFPAGYPVARVSRVAHERDQPFATVQARPAAALNRVRELLLVWTGEDESTPAGTVVATGRPDAAPRRQGLAAMAPFVPTTAAAAAPASRAMTASTVPQ